MSDNFIVEDEGPARRYYCQIPNMIDDAHLSPAAFRLYVHLKRVTGEAPGQCYQSTRTLATECHCSPPTIVSAKKELIEAGLIGIQEVPGTIEQFIYHRITITNIWAINTALYKQGGDPLDAMLYAHLDPARAKNLYGTVQKICTDPCKNFALKNNLKNNNINGVSEKSSLTEGEKPDQIQDQNLSLPVEGESDSEEEMPLKAAPKLDPTEAYKKRLEESMWKGITAHAGKKDRILDYPEDCQDVLEIFSDLWGIRPPPKGAKSGAYGDWINGARQLLDACGEFGPELIREVSQDFRGYMQSHNGLPPYMVSRPGSIYQATMSKAGEKRIENDTEKQQAQAWMDVDYTDPMTLDVLRHPDYVSPEQYAVLKEGYRVYLIDHPEMKNILLEGKNGRVTEKS